MVISSFISSILVLAVGIWAYLRLESTMNAFTERQLLIEPSRYSYQMWKDMPVTMYQSFTFFNLTNWGQVKSVGQKPRFVEVGPYVYRTSWTKSDVNFLDEDKLVSFAERKQWHFQAHLSHGHEDDQIWTINTPLMTALALIQNAPVITRNIVSVILDGLGEGAFIKRPVRSLLFEGYSDLIVSVGPLFDRRFANFNGKFAYLYNKNDTTDGQWTVATGLGDVNELNKVKRFQSSIVNLTSQGQMAQGLNEVKPECASAWSLDQATNGQLFAPFDRDHEHTQVTQQLGQINARARALAEHPARVAASPTAGHRAADSIVQAPKRFFGRSTGAQSATGADHDRGTQMRHHHEQTLSQHMHQTQISGLQEQLLQLRDLGKFIFYPDLCRPIHLVPDQAQLASEHGIMAYRYTIDPRVFMNSSQAPSNKCFEMNPRPPLANALAATINSVTGANVQVPSIVSSASSPFAMFSPPSSGGAGGPQQHHESSGAVSGLFERSNHHHHHPSSSFLNNALHSLSATANQAADQLAASSSNTTPIGRLSRVRQLFTNMVSQRMSGAGPLLPSLSAGPAGLLMSQGAGAHAHHLHLFPPVAHLAPNARLAPDGPGPQAPVATGQATLGSGGGLVGRQMGVPQPTNLGDDLASSPSQAAIANQPERSGARPPLGLASAGASLASSAGPPTGGSDRWVTQFRFKWPRGVFSIGQCQLGAPIYVSLPHFLDADEFYLEQVDGLRPNRSLHEFYIDVESTLRSIPVNAKARLQLNVATPELRFRNIPNAMIPVLWQEVTFKMDRSVATLLFWSFTMSSTIYKLIAVLTIGLGCALLINSFLGGFRRRQAIYRSAASALASGQASGVRKRRSSGSASSQADSQLSASSLNSTKEGHRSSWRPHIIVPPEVRPQSRSLSAKRLKPDVATGGHSLDDLRPAAACVNAMLNYGFDAGSCRDLQRQQLPELHGDERHSPGSCGPPSSTGSACNPSSVSPKQLWSRASSNCELVPAGAGRLPATNCAGCLFACMRHHLPSEASAHCPHHEQLQPINCLISRRSAQRATCRTTSDSSLLQSAGPTASDLDKATLTSRESNTDSCSSIYPTQRGRSFKPS